MLDNRFSKFRLLVREENQVGEREELLYFLQSQLLNFKKFKVLVREEKQIGENEALL